MEKMSLSQARSLAHQLRQLRAGHYLYRHNQQPDILAQPLPRHALMQKWPCLECVLQDWNPRCLLCWKACVPQGRTDKVSVRYVEQAQKYHYKSLATTCDRPACQLARP